MSVLPIESELSTYKHTLDPDNATLAAYFKEMEGYTDNFLREIDHLPAFNNNGFDRTDEDSFMNLAETAKLPAILNFIKARIDGPGIQPGSGAHMGYIPGGGVFESAIGDYLAAVSNQYSGVFYANPGAVRLENFLIKWAGNLIGYKDGFAGNLTSGGSMANLMAIDTARNSMAITAAKIEKSVIYLSRQAHHSLLKAIKITGLSECKLRIIPNDEHYRIRIDLLELAITEDQNAGLNPFMVVSNGGSTDVGAVDSLVEVSRIATANKMWHHVDGAYGGFFMLTKRGREKLTGIELADSVILDPHKGLFLPYGSGIILIKDGKKLKENYSQEANYMQDAVEDSSNWSPADCSPELSRHFRAYRMWLPLKIHGVGVFEDCLNEKLTLANYFYQKVGLLGYMVGPRPDLSVVLFKLDGVEEQGNERNQLLINKIHKKCPVFISSTTINGVFWLRAAILSFRTHKKDVDVLLTFLEQNRE